MKKLLLLSLALLWGFALLAQKVNPDIRRVALSDFDQKQPVTADLGTKSQSPATYPAPNVVPTDDPNIVTIIQIGSAANAYGYGYNNGAATFVWADPNINSVTNTHRMGGEVGPPGQYSGDLAYDISTDGGMTWTNQIKMYESNVAANPDAARYPQGAIYNPPGNTDPMNAWMTFFAATLDGSNGGTWGGYGYGVASIADPTDTTKHLLHSDLEAGFAQGIPTAYHITQQGDAWMADAALQDSYVAYLGNIIFMHGVFNDAIGDYEWEQFLVPATADYARYLKMAFSPDGLNGYVFWCSNNASIPFYDEAAWDYPLLLKTDDGGATWADDLISVQLGGPDGIPVIKNWLTDEQLDGIFGPGTWDRDQLIYSGQWWNTDVAVDAGGNPHIITQVFLGYTDEGTNYIIVEPHTFGMFDIYSFDGETLDQAVLLGTNQNYDGVFQPDDFTEYNRAQASTTLDGTKMFFSWIDTQIEGIEENRSPDVFTRGFDLISNNITVGDAPGGCDNVTAFSLGMWQSWFMAASYYVFEESDNYTMPMIYETLNPDNVIEPVRFNYIQDWSYNVADFTQPSGNPPFPWVGIEEPEANASISVSQNYPNPFSGTTVIDIYVPQASEVSVEVTNLIGQTIYQNNMGTVSGNARISLKASEFTSGVYFYTVRAGDQSMTRQMIVE